MDINQATQVNQQGDPYLFYDRFILDSARKKLLRMTSNYPFGIHVVLVE